FGQDSDWLRTRGRVTPPTLPSWLRTSLRPAAAFLSAASVARESSGGLSPTRPGCPPRRARRRCRARAHPASAGRYGRKRNIVSRRRYARRAVRTRRQVTALLPGRRRSCRPPTNLPGRKTAKRFDGRTYNAESAPPCWL